MNKKFPYGHDVNNYIDKAFLKIKKIYPWTTKDMFSKDYEYKIEKIGNRYQFVSIYRYNDYESRRVLKCDGEEFIKEIFRDQESYVQNANEVKEVYIVPGGEGKIISGWYLERYEIRSHKLGGYSAFVQAGDRVAGGSRTFFIPNSFFEGDFNSFLDKYLELVYPSFGFNKEELLHAKGLKEFLGF